MRRPAALAALVGTFLLFGGPPAAAHPLGNFTVNRYAGIVLRPEEVVVHYVLDLAEIPAFQEETAIDTDGDGVEEGELRSWAVAAVASIVNDLDVEVDREPVVLRVRRSSATTPSGQGGLSTLRLEATFAAHISAASGLLTFEDRSEPGRLGWREITATSADGVALVRPTVPAASVSDRLRTYPDDLLSSPLSVTAMEAAFHRGPSGAAPLSTVLAGESSPISGGGPFAAVIAYESIWLVLLGLVIALAFGAWHALLPGHGKTLMAAAMVGSGARPRQAVVAGASVALMHSFSVIALGLLVLALERAFRPEAVYPWLGVASGAVAVSIGGRLLRSRWGAWKHARSHGDRDDGSNRDHDHATHGHLHELPPEGLLSRRGIVALAFAGGILPAPSALIVMLAAIQGQRVVYGLTLVLAFSFGLAASLIVVGLGAMRARRAMEDRLPTGARLLVPMFSSSAIVVVGLYLTTRGFISL